MSTQQQIVDTERKISTVLAQAKAQVDQLRSGISPQIQPPAEYAETMDAMRTDECQNIIATVSCRLLDTGDGEAAGVVDSLMSTLRSIATLLETRGGHDDRMPEDAYRMAMRLTCDYKRPLPRPNPRGE